ncbi:N(6)-adenine-specific methyltransferase METTL4 [Drosophila nasuta]|uniref:N(6)-adenine-specific methyltransferase METTL4 n=1 Tax=Drosophila nasuta TaxID=42062 RepID=UPI00295E6DFC|nr:N(6)-adenine-specific methyltransferase METTL4 [Drosophila nasuta]
MLKVQSNLDKQGRYAILLNHRELINQIYSATVTDNTTYELKKQLFYFHQPKTTTTNQKKRKRKLNDAPNIQQSEDNITEYLKLLPEVENSDVETSLPRYWEAEYTLPQLHGSNLSGKFQEFHNGNSSSYIIPQAARFYNHNVEQLTALLPQLLPSYDVIVLDPPWRNKYIRRIKRTKQELGYAMLDNDQLSQLPLGQLIHERTLVAIWCTNSRQHQQALETNLLSSWRLRLLHKLRWYKLNTEHQLISDLNSGDVTQKQPYEMLYLACHVESDASYAEELKQTELLLSIPSIVHSHKPPLLEWLRSHLKLGEHQKEPNCLELFARYLQPNFTSIGLEVLKLMNERLYDKVVKQI